MKNDKAFSFVIIACWACLLSFANTLHCAAQDPAQLTQLENSLNEIDRDLQQKSLTYSWLLTEDYLNLCTTVNKTIDISKEDYLKTLTTEKKPQELAPFEESYKNAKNELKTYMRKYGEYVKAEQLRKKAVGETERKEANNAMNSVCTRLWNEDPKVQELRKKELNAFKLYRIETVRFMLNEYKAMKRIMPNTFINYEDKNTILDNNTVLKRLSLEIAHLESLQREVLNKYQRIKYNLEDTQKK